MHVNQTFFLHLLPRLLEAYYPEMSNLLSLSKDEKLDKMEEAVERLKSTDDVKGYEFEFLKTTYFHDRDDLKKLKELLTSVILKGWFSNHIEILTTSIKTGEVTSFKLTLSNIKNGLNLIYFYQAPYFGLVLLDCFKKEYTVINSELGINFLTKEETERLLLPKPRINNYRNPKLVKLNNDNEHLKNLKKEIVELLEMDKEFNYMVDFYHIPNQYLYLENYHQFDREELNSVQILNDGKVKFLNHSHQLSNKELKDANDLLKGVHDIQNTQGRIIEGHYENISPLFEPAVFHGIGYAFGENDIFVNESGQVFLFHYQARPFLHFENFYFHLVNDNALNTPTTYISNKENLGITIEINPHFSRHFRPIPFANINHNNEDYKEKVPYFDVMFEDYHLAYEATQKLRRKWLENKTESVQELDWIIQRAKELKEKLALNCEETAIAYEQFKEEIGFI